MRLRVPDPAMFRLQAEVPSSYAMELSTCCIIRRRPGGTDWRKSSDRDFAYVLVHLAAPHEATGDLRGLMTCAGGRGMGREVTRGGDQDRCNLWVALPGEALLHRRLQVLQHVEAGILPQDRVAQNFNEIGG